MRGAPRMDVAAAMLLTVGGIVEAVLGLTGVREPWTVVVTVPFVTVPVALRRRWTALATGLLVTALLTQAALGSDLPGGFSEGLALVLVVYAAGRCSVRRAVALLVVVLAALAVVIAIGEDPRPTNFVYMATVVAASWAAGVGLRLADERSELLAERRVMQERARIAGELHDVVSHNVSAIVVQAGAERRDQPAESEAARTLSDIESHGRQTLAELRRLLGVLHVTGDAAPLRPQPGIADLPDLVRACSASGLTVRLVCEGEPCAVGDSLSLAVYRVVQEALTNVRKHSAAGEASVVLRWGRQEVEVEVLDHGPSRRRRLPGAGFGLRAMAERVGAYGGSLTTGVGADGFRVLARLPLERP